MLNSLNAWKQKIYRFIDQYSEQVQMHIEQAQNRLNDQWNITEEEYLQMFNHFVLESVDQLPQGLSRKPFSVETSTLIFEFLVCEQIHPNDVREIDTRPTDVQRQMTNLFARRDLLHVNFDLCSLGGDIYVSRGHFSSPTMNSSVPSSSQSFHSLENIPHLDRICLRYRFDVLSTDTSA